MPHFKCVACKARLYSEASPADLVDDRCPRCGSPLEPVGELAEIVGFQSIESYCLGDRRTLAEAVAQAAALPTPKDTP